MFKKEVKKISLVITDGESILLLENDNKFQIPSIVIDGEGDLYKTISQKFKSVFNLDLKKHEKNIRDMGPFNVTKDTRFYILILDKDNLPPTNKLKYNPQISNKNGKFYIESPLYNIDYFDIENLLNDPGVKIIGMFIRTYLNKNNIRFGKSRHNVLGHIGVNDK